jgi:hypothetical protein
MKFFRQCISADPYLFVFIGGKASVQRCTMNVGRKGTGQYRTEDDMVRQGKIE